MNQQLGNLGTLHVCGSCVAKATCGLLTMKAGDVCNALTGSWKSISHNGLVMLHSLNTWGIFSLMAI